MEVVTAILKPVAARRIEEVVDFMTQGISQLPVCDGAAIKAWMLVLALVAKRLRLTVEQWGKLEREVTRIWLV